jgi:diacylglycerol kinase (ATP)
VDGLHFLNSCGFGFDASVLEASNQVRFLKGDAVYIYSALRQLFGYRGIEVSSTGITGANRTRKLMVTASNGKSLGGAFQIAPRASVTDGNLDICFIADTNAINRVRLFAAALRGKHIGMPGVAATTRSQLDLLFETAPTMEVDGELRVARDRHVELACVPGALAVIAAPGALR